MERALASEREANAERVAKVLFDVLMGLAGQGADVDIDVDDIGDDVRLGLAGGDTP